MRPVSRSVFQNKIHPGTTNQQRISSGARALRSATPEKTPQTRPRRIIEGISTGFIGGGVLIATVPAVINALVTSSSSAKNILSVVGTSGMLLLFAGVILMVYLLSRKA